MNAPVQWHALAGRSMWPLGAPLQAGVVAVDASVLRPGDLVVFIADFAPRTVLHRVVHVTADMVVTRGDANGYDDPPVPHPAILGRVEALRWRGQVLPLPQAGWTGQLLRDVGIAWSRLAPGLRRAVAVQRQRVRRVADP